jgi:hypothetical protein
MRNLNFSALFLAAGLAFTATAAMAQDRYGYDYDRYERQDLREDHRDLRKDYAQVDRLRADIARDQYRRNEALRWGNRREANRIGRDISRDQRALNALLRDIARDRGDMRKDERSLYRERGSSGYR